MGLPSQKPFGYGYEYEYGYGYGHFGSGFFSSGFGGGPTVTNWADLPAFLRRVMIAYGSASPITAIVPFSMSASILFTPNTHDNCD